MGETPSNAVICKGSTSILWDIMCVQDFWCAMITKSFLQDVDDFGRVALACKEVVFQDYLGIEISKGEVIHIIWYEALGVGVSGVGAFWAWNLIHV